MRIKRAVNAVKKRRKIMKQAKGYYGGKHTFIVLQSNNFSRAAFMHTLAESKRNVISDNSGLHVSTLLHVSTV